MDTYEIYAIVVCLLVAGLWLLVKAWRAIEAGWERRGDRLRAYKARINQLPFEEVRARAELLLNNLDPEDYSRSTSDAKDVPQQLPPLVRDLFSRYETLTFADYTFNREDIKAYPWNPAFVVISEESEASLLVKPLDETIYSCSDDELADDLKEDSTYPTIYHWIVMNDPANDDL